MTDIPISPNIWKLAAAILTQKQHTILELREKHGYSWNQLAIYTNTGKATVREHHRAATKNLHDAIELAGGDIDRALAQTRPTSENGGPPSTSSSPKAPSPSSTSDPETASSSASTEPQRQAKPNRSSTPSNTPAPDTKSSSSPPAPTSESSTPKTSSSHET